MSNHSRTSLYEANGIGVNSCQRIILVVPLGFVLRNKGIILSNTAKHYIFALFDGRFHFAVKLILL
jgi:hypothetical protein